jgi:hypothetical protein
MSILVNRTTNVSACVVVHHSALADIFAAQQVNENGEIAQHTLPLDPRTGKRSACGGIA